MLIEQQHRIIKEFTISITIHIHNNNILDNRQQSKPKQFRIHEKQTSVANKSMPQMHIIHNKPKNNPIAHIEEKDPNITKKNRSNNPKKHRQRHLQPIIMPSIDIIDIMLEIRFNST